MGVNLAKITTSMLSPYLGWCCEKNITATFELKVTCRKFITLLMLLAWSIFQKAQASAKLQKAMHSNTLIPMIDY